MRLAITLAVTLVVAMAHSAEAGPFRRRSSSTSQPATCTGPNCSAGGSTATAQGVADIQASNGRMAHHGGNSSYEGVGMGSTPQAALNACCNNGRPVIDQGVSQGANGMWYACKRYAR